MKSINSSYRPCKRDQSYPYIGMSENGIIVLFNRTHCGTILLKSSSVSSVFNVGEYRTDWIESNFKPIGGEVVLSNN